MTPQASADAVSAMGVEQLDRLIAPLPRGSRVLISNEPGVEGEPFLYQAASHHVEGGGDVVYVVTNRPPESILRSMSEFDLAPDHDHVHFIDAYSPGLGLTGDAEFPVMEPSNPGAFVEAVEAAAEKYPDALLIVDSLSHLLDHGTMEEVEGYLPRLASAMGVFQLAIALFIAWPYEEDLTGFHEIFDSVVTLHGVEGRILLSQYFQVDRADWVEDLDTRPRLYKAIRPGGIYVYIPKIVITGPYNAGKSTFVNSVSDSSVSVDRLGTTVAMDHGHVEVDGIVVDLFGTPGQSRFDPILETIGERGLGVLVIVDATRPDAFPRAQEMLEALWRYGTPALVVANKQDLPGALTPEEVREQLDLPPNVGVVGCVGEEPESAREVLSSLIEEVLSSSAFAGGLEEGHEGVVA